MKAFDWRDDLPYISFYSLLVVITVFVILSILRPFHFKNEQSTSLVCIEVINNREIDFSGFSSIESQPDNGTVIWTMRSNKGSMRYIQWPGEVCSTDRDILATWNLEDE